MHSRRTTPAVNRRAFLAASAGGAAAAATMAGSANAAANELYDLVIVGGGNAGMPAAIFSAQRGAKVLIIEAAGMLGGTLHLSSGQMSAGGTKLQKSKGIDDSGELHFQDVMKISRGTADPVIAKLACLNNGETFDWLMDHGLDVSPSHPETGTTHEPYSRARYAWGKSGGRSILRILNEQLKPHIDSGKVTVLLNTKAKAVLKDGRGAAIGVEAEDADGKTASYRGKNVLLTVGGATANPEMFKAIEGKNSYNDSTYPYSQGEGFTIGRNAGGYIRNGEKYTPLFGAILAETETPSPVFANFRPWPPERPPYEIYVNLNGQRFMAEDRASHDYCEQALLAQPETLCFVMFDQAMMDAAPQIVGGRGGKTTREQYLALFNNRPHFYKADTVDELAKKAGFNAAGVAATVDEFNAGQKAGKDKYGRQHMPLPISKGPYYAIKLHSWKLIDFGGLAVDGQLRVIDKQNRPIPNLYAAGEIIGAGTTMGQSYCGGMSVTPALTFGRLLGQKMLKFA